MASNGVASATTAIEAGFKMVMFGIPLARHANAEHEAIKWSLFPRAARLQARSGRFPLNLPLALQPRSLPLFNIDYKCEPKDIENAPLNSAYRGTGEQATRARERARPLGAAPPSLWRTDAQKALYLEANGDTNAAAIRTAFARSGIASRDVDFRRNPRGQASSKAGFTAIGGDVRAQRDIAVGNDHHAA